MMAYSDKISLYHFYDGLWYDLAGTQTHDLPCEADTLTRNGPVVSKLNTNSVVAAFVC